MSLRAADPAIRASATAPALVAALSLLLSWLLSGCGADDGSAAGSGSGSGGKLSVVASFYPLEFVVRQVGGGDVAAENLTKPGVEPHDLELDPRQVASVSEAGLVVYLKGLQPAVDEAVEQNPPEAALDVSGVVPLEDHGRVEEEHAGEEPAGEHAGDGEDGGDPHLWLDPTKLATVAAAVGAKLAEVDGGHADGYRSRAADLVERLRALDAEFSTGLKTCQRREIVTSHAAFGYLAERYRLQQVGISGVNPEAEPSPARLAEVQRIVSDKGVTTIFFETLVSPKTAQSLARDAKVSTAVLDPLEGVTDPAKEDYFSVMRANLTALRKALGCS